jgi:amino acid permease
MLPPAIPFAFYTMGLLIAPILASVFCWLVCYTLHIIGVFQYHQRAVSYQQVCKDALGNTHEKAMLFAIIILLTGACTAFMTIIPDMLQPQMADAFGADSLVANRIFIVIAGMVVLVPPCYITSMAKLAPLSLVTVSAMVYLVLLLICRSAVQLSEHGIQLAPGELAKFSGQTFAGLQIFTFAFGCQPTYALIFSDLEQPTLLKMDRVSGWGMGLCLALYCVCGLMGVLFCESINYRDPVTGESSVPDNILAAFQIPNSVQLANHQQPLDSVSADVTIAANLIVLAVLSSFVLCHFAVRNCLEDLLLPNSNERSDTRDSLSDLKVSLVNEHEGARATPRTKGFQGAVFYLEPVIFVGISGALAVAIPSLSTVLTFSGASGGTFAHHAGCVEILLLSAALTLSARHSCRDLLVSHMPRISATGRQDCRPHPATPT